MDDDDGVSIKTVSNYFRGANPPYGVWTAGLRWMEDGGVETVEILNGTIGGGTADHNISGDVQAVLAGLKRASELGLNATIYSVNDSVIRTIPEYYQLWQKRGWKNSKKETPDSLEAWQEIKSICDEIDVSWRRREKGKIDTLADHLKFQQMLEEQDREFWMHRAIAKDPY